MTTQDKAHLLHLCMKTATPAIQAYIWDEEDILPLLAMADLPREVIPPADWGMKPLHVSTASAYGDQEAYPHINEDKWAGGVLHVTLRMEGRVLGTFLAADTQTED